MATIINKSFRLFGLLLLIAIVFISHVAAKDMGKTSNADNVARKSHNEEKGVKDAKYGGYPGGAAAGGYPGRGGGYPGGGGRYSGGGGYCRFGCCGRRDYYRGYCLRCCGRHESVSSVGGANIEVKPQN